MKTRRDFLNHALGGVVVSASIPSFIDPGSRGVADMTPGEKVKAEITPQYSSSKRTFEYEEKDEHSPFFRIEPVGGVRKYFLNKNHNFFKKIWMNPLCTDFMKESLKLIISAIGETSLGASDDARRWYFEEISQWSRHLHVTTDTFVEKNDLKDEEENIIENEDFDDKLPN